MDDQYYRKPKQKSHVTMWLKNVIKNKNVLLTLVVVIPIFSFITFSNRGILKRMSLEAEKEAMQEKVRHAQEEQKTLLEQSKALEKDNKAIEKVARERYGMVREGETVYKVKKEK
ncbi:MAG: septum formation initiator family protein [Ignavibacteriae bacterium]|nr:septum formation initiator family protein [Ignavibacteria bacterium]MBI3363288.1 septum formation initiator family protein [Ignavibacteriota bacterium]